MNFSPEEVKTEKIKSKEEPKKINRYRSKEGFVKTEIIRGIFEIDHLFPIVKSHGSFICGGYARYCMSPNQNPALPVDIDIYTPNEKIFEELKFYFIDKERLKVKHENKISITFHRPKEGKYAYHLPIQIIKPIKEGHIVTSFTNGDILQVLRSFDFTVIRCALIDQHIGYTDADFEHDEKEKIIRIKNIHCPVSSTLRCMKYSKRGYYLPPTQVVKLMVDWMDRDDDYRMKILDYIQKLNEYNITQEEIDELESLLNVD